MISMACDLLILLWLAVFIRQATSNLAQTPASYPQYPASLLPVLPPHPRFNDRSGTSPYPLVLLVKRRMLCKRPQSREMLCLTGFR